MNDAKLPFRVFSCDRQVLLVVVLVMSSFTFDFDLKDDLDESFDVITPQKPAVTSSIDKAPVPERAPGGGIPASAEEIPLSTLVRDRHSFKLPYDSYLPCVWQHSSPHFPTHSHIRL